MNSLADESVGSPIIARLRRDRHRVDAIEELSPGIPDTAVLDRAVRYDLLLLAVDLDFGDLIFRERRPAPMAGVVLIRIGAAQNAQQKSALVEDTLAQLSPAQLAHHLTIITPNQVRMRPLP
ncbi:MAG TPA: DUF5615 family PIN-like protein [Ktedonobacterales bacterium]